MTSNAMIPYNGKMVYSGMGNGSANSRPSGGGYANLILQQPAGYALRGSTNLQAATGQPDYPIGGRSRVFSPEDQLADTSLILPDVLCEHAGDSILPVTAINGGFTWLGGDYPTIANLRQLLSAWKLVATLGRNDNTSYALTPNGSGVFSLTAISDPNIILGFQIEWGLSVLNYAPFNLTVATQFFRGASYQPVDRTYTLRMDPQSGIGTSGIFTFPFAQRVAASDTCGYTAATRAHGTMMQAIVQPAWVGNKTDAISDLPPVAVSTGGFPTLTITVPSAFNSTLSITCHLLTAASPYLASYMQDTFLGAMLDETAVLMKQRQQPNA